MGAKTAFSASECAEALNYLALAGYDTQEMADTLPTVLNLSLIHISCSGQEMHPQTEQVAVPTAFLLETAQVANE